MKSPYSFRNFSNLLCALADPDVDGRVLVQYGEKNELISLKYLLLNPANKFQSIIEDAQAVIFAGGTMSPVDSFVKQV
jgi:chromosome transmission fidelity protein 1